MIRREICTIKTFGSDVKLQAPEILPNVFQHVSPFQIYGYVGYLYIKSRGVKPPVSMGFRGGSSNRQIGFVGAIFLSGWAGYVSVRVTWWR